MYFFGAPDNDALGYFKSGDGTGSFNAAVSIGIYPNYSIREIQAGDFDNDGNQDIIISTKHESVPIRILWGNGSGFFPTSTDLPGTLVSGGNIIIADFDKDGRDDFAITNRYSTSAVIGSLFFLNNGSVNPSGPYEIDTSASVFSKHLASGDFNGDTYPDLVSVTSNGQRQIHLWNTSSDDFDAPLNFGPLSLGEKIAVGDYNGDGCDDVIKYHDNSTHLKSINICDGSATFQADQNVNSGFSNGAVLLSNDINNDGYSDLLEASFFFATPMELDYFYFNDASGNLLKGATSIPGAAQTRVIIAEDLNNDGKDDFLFLGDSVLVGNTSVVVLNTYY